VFSALGSWHGPPSGDRGAGAGRQRL